MKKEKFFLNLVICGHIDHGKSTLIGRLLYDTGALSDKLTEKIKEEIKAGNDPEFAFVMDAFEEERRDLMTIDTTRKFFETKKRRYVIIDTPGHKEYMRNMLTGASRADAAVLVIDAKEGICEQTLRHINALKFLGVKNIIVAVNKMDLVDYDEQIFADLQKLLSQTLGLCLLLKTGLSRAVALRKGLRKQHSARQRVGGIVFVPISAQKGENIIKKSGKMKWHKGPSLLEVLDKITHSTGSGQEIGGKNLIMPVQDVYSEYQPGMRHSRLESVVVGKIESGEIKIGQFMKVLPSELLVKISEIKIFGKKNVKKASAGENVGLVLRSAGKGETSFFRTEHRDLKKVRFGSGRSHLEEPIFVRGNILVFLKDKKIKSSKIIHANIFWISEKPWSKGDKLTIKLATQEIPCVIKKIILKINTETMEKTEKSPQPPLLKGEQNGIKETEAADVILEAETPVVYCEFQENQTLGRFVLEKNGSGSTGSPQAVVAAGIVVK